jgi:hypothetical protein
MAWANSRTNGSSSLAGGSIGPNSGDPPGRASSLCTLPLPIFGFAIFSPAVIYGFNSRHGRSSRGNAIAALPSSGAVRVGCPSVQVLSGRVADRQPHQGHHDFRRGFSGVGTGAGAVPRTILGELRMMFPR